MTSNKDMKWTDVVGHVNNVMLDYHVILKRLEVLEDALATVANWNSHPDNLVLTRGSNGLRDFYRSIAIKGIEDSEALLDQLKESGDE